MRVDLRRLWLFKSRARHRPVKPRITTRVPIWAVVVFTATSGAALAALAAWGTLWLSSHYRWERGLTTLAVVFVDLLVTVLILRAVAEIVYAFNRRRR